MFTIIDNKVYVIENDKMFPVNVSIEKGVEKVGEGVKLPKDYPLYTLREIQIKFGVEKEKAYFYDKEKYEKELEEEKNKEKAEERAKIEEEIRAKIEEETSKSSQNNSQAPKQGNQNKNQ